MFEEGTRLKARFNYKGLCTIEDLWDISLDGTKNEDDKGLKGIYQNLNKQLKDCKETKFLNEDLPDEEGLVVIKKTKEEELIELKRNIVKHIYITKYQEQKEQENKITKSIEKQKLLEILANKQNERFYDMSEEELLKIIDKL